MKIINPAPAAASLVTAQDRTDLTAALDALAAEGAREPDAETIRAQLSAGKRGRFSDGHLCQVAAELGLKVEW